MGIRIKQNVEVRVYQDAFDCRKTKCKREDSCISAASAVSPPLRYALFKIKMCAAEEGPKYKEQRSNGHIYGRPKEKVNTQQKNNTKKKIPTIRSA